MAFVPEQFRDELAPRLSGEVPWGTMYLADDWLPADASTQSAMPWRSLAVPRIHLLLSGRHKLALMRKGRVQRVELLPGDMWFFPPRAHECETFQFDCSYLGLVFHPDYLRIIRVDHWVDRPEDRLRNRRIHHWHGKTPELLNRQLEVLQDICRLPEDASLARSAAESFWRLVDHWMAQTNFEVEAHAVQRKAFASWMKIQHYVQDHYHLPIDRKTAAVELGLSPNRIYVLCRQFGQQGFQELLEEKRMLQAKSYLTNSRLKVEAVAALCGYSGAPYFIRAFRKLTGVSPGQWRLNQIREL